ncbi:hypothetical protein HDV02_003352 [Globomyces sp. JEL0801]|nr:hypothetical protein HDV02_003352 [Globomyces sp. JEL0801]
MVFMDLMRKETLVLFSPFLLNMPETKVPIDLNTMDFSVSPADSFDKYCNGGWYAQTRIPNDLPDLTVYRALGEKSKEDLKAIYDSLSDCAPGESLLADLFQSGLDLETIESNGISPFLNDLEAIDRVQTTEELIVQVAELHKASIHVFWGHQVMSDFLDSTRLCSLIFQDGLGLPTREYYLLDKYSNTVTQYLAYLEKLHFLLGHDLETSKQYSSEIFNLEKQIAEYSIAQEDVADFSKIENELTLEKLNGVAPNVNILKYYETLGVETTGTIMALRLDYFENVSALLEITPLDVLKRYMKFHLLKFYSPYLNKDYATLHFDFFKKSLNGIAEQAPRWKDVVKTVSECLDDLVSQIYVEKHFTPEAKQAAQDLAHTLIKSFENRIQKVDWMKEETKLNAYAKLKTLLIKVGYPDEWKDYSPLKSKIVRSQPYALNVKEANVFKTLLDLKTINGPVNRKRWNMAPYEVNAYYNPMVNEIVFPAAILQPPFFYPPTKELPFGQPALNYAGIGSVIAHEITHGFDHMGRRFNADGNQMDWWQPEDNENFTQRAELIIEQYNNYSLYGHHVNGKLTQGENIADLGGVNIALMGFKKFLENHKDDTLPSHPKYSQIQLFFIGFAQAERTLDRKEAVINRIATDPHSPGQFRINGPLTNIPEFYEAFNVKEGNGMYTTPLRRVSIW